MLLAVLCAVALFITSDDVVITEGFPMVKSLAIVLILLGSFSIFNYKTRKRQVLLNTFSIAINALLIGLLSYWMLNLSGGISFPEKGIELVFPILAILGLFIANFYIRRDEKLVKSVDRLR